MTAALATIGDNSRTPAQADAIMAVNEIAAFLDGCPVIQAAEDADKGARVLKAAKAAAAGMKTERTARLAPLNEQVAEIRSGYAGSESTLETLSKRLAALLTAFTVAEQERRAREAEAARQAAEAAERAAREAEAREQAALDDAAAGVVGAGVAVATVQADEAFAEHRRASRFARIADKNVGVKLGAGDGTRALSLRTQEVITVTDPAALLAATGLTEPLHDAMRTAARAHRKATGELPPGVTVTLDRRL
jgi:hypothetical protein